MAKKREYQLTAGQVWGLKQTFGLTQSRNEIDLAQRQYLINALTFTEAEEEQINFVTLPPVQRGVENFNFDQDAPLMREFTKAQKQKLIKTGLDAMPSANDAYFRQWILPAMIVLGYEVPVANWDDDEDDDE